MEWKWIEPSDLPKVAVKFKADIYKRLLDKLKSLKLN